jgi:hypothetical protein
MQLVRTWALVGAMVLVFGIIGFFVVREYRAGVAEECVALDCPSDYDYR